MESSEWRRLRNEIRADLELMWGSQADSNNRIESLSSSIEKHGQQIAEQGRQIAEQGRQIAEQGRQIAEQSLRIEESMRQSAALGREVAAIGHQLVGRLRQFDHRFGVLIDSLETDNDKRISVLEERVTRLEQKTDPAA